MNDADITIRSATVVDVDEVAAMWGELAVLHSRYNAERWRWRDDAGEQFARYFCDALGNDRTIALVAQARPGAGGELIGFLIGSTGKAATVLAAGIRGEISDLYVRPDWRGRGIGTQLIRQAMAVMEKRGAEHVVLSVAEGNDAAMKMYEKLGFASCVVQLFRTLDGKPTNAR